MFLQELTLKISNNTFLTLLKFLNNTCNRVILLLFIKTYFSFGSNKLFMKSYLRTEDLQILIGILKMESLLGPYWKNMQIMKYWKEWRQSVKHSKTLNKMLPYYAMLWKKLGCWTILFQEIFIHLYRDKCCFWSLIFTFTYLFMFLNNSQLFLNAFWESK